jgi:hypothetical protein
MLDLLATAAIAGHFSGRDPLIVALATVAPNIIVVRLLQAKLPFV